MSDPIDPVIDYHQATKHHFQRYAAGPGYLDWANQPNPFRRYEGAPLLALEHIPIDPDPPYAAAFLEGQIPPQPINFHSISRLFYDSLALSAWKQAGRSTWSLRVNPSSGNLHPTEGYLLCSPVEGLSERPIVAHYAPREHALEIRAELPTELWETLTGSLGGLCLALTSIHWREAWKYGERAFRYCQHDVGHAVAALAVAAAGLGWRTRLLDGWGADELATLLGIARLNGPEVEHPDCLLAVFPGTDPVVITSPAVRRLSRLARLTWYGTPNVLSPQHVHWQRIEAIATASRKPVTAGTYPPFTTAWPVLAIGDTALGLRPIVHRRRSAVDMDGRSGITLDAFYSILRKTLPGPRQVPFTTIPWPPQVHLALFVHRVQGLNPGLYLLVRDPAQQAALKQALREEFTWKRPPRCPQELALYELAVGDTRELAKQLSCHQDIAAEGCFSMGMLARFEPALREFGPWFYPRLFWETGLVGQVLYLEAYAFGIAATGIGCFFDDPMHAVLGLNDYRYQSLYHFTLGVAVEDPRILSLPPYPGPDVQR